MPTPSALAATCLQGPTTQWLSDPPYENYFYSDCHSASQVVVTSPLPDSNLTIIGPRLLVAWPAGNSGVVAFFRPQNGVNGSLAIALENGTSTFPVHGAYSASMSDPSANPYVGVSALVNFNSSAVLSVPIIGSIRNIRGMIVSKAASPGKSIATFSQMRRFHGRSFDPRPADPRCC